MDELVTTLSTGKHPVAMERCKDLKELQEMLDRNYVLVKFIETQGGTELGFKLDNNTSRLDADFEAGTGTIHLEGELELNYEKVRMFADIDIATRKGSGYLQPINQEKSGAA